MAFMAHFYNANHRN